MQIVQKSVQNLTWLTFQKKDRFAYVQHFTNAYHVSTDYQRFETFYQPQFFKPSTKQNKYVQSFFSNHSYNKFTITRFVDTKRFTKTFFDHTVEQPTYYRIPDNYYHRMKFLLPSLLVAVADGLCATTSSSSHLTTPNVRFCVLFPQNLDQKFYICIN